jgi:hypothetical protein
MQRPTQFSNTNEFVVEAILSKRVKRGQTEYRVKWEGQDINDATWEPKENLENISNMIEEYENTHKRKKGPPGARENYYATNDIKIGIDLFESPPKALDKTTNNEIKNKMNPNTNIFTNNNTNTNTNTNMKNSMKPNGNSNYGTFAVTKNNLPINSKNIANTNHPDNNNNNSGNSKRVIPNGAINLEQNIISLETENLDTATSTETVSILYELLDFIPQNVHTVKKYGGELYCLSDVASRNGKIIKAFIPTSLLKETFPRLLIEFYESRVKFVNRKNIK